MSPSVDNVVKLIVCFWFFVALVAGLALFLDIIFVSLIPKFKGKTFYTLLQSIHNPFLLFLCTVLTMFLQVVIIDQILPHNSQFNTKYLLFRYIYPLLQS